MRGGSPAAAAVENAARMLRNRQIMFVPLCRSLSQVQMQVNPARQKFHNLLHGLKFRQVAAPIGSHAAADVEGTQTTFADLAKNYQIRRSEWCCRAEEVDKPSAI